MSRPRTTLMDCIPTGPFLLGSKLASDPESIEINIPDRLKLIDQESF